MRDNMKHILVTGAGGFIGGHIVAECLRRGCFVHALTHKKTPQTLLNLARENRINLLRANICNLKQLKAAFAQTPELTAVIHCAALARDTGREKDFMAVNYEAVKLVAQLAQTNARRFVYISTTDVYGLYDFNGETEAELGYDAKAVNPYPKYKIMSEKWLAAHLPKDAYSIIRPAAVWGEDDTTLTQRARDFLAWSPFIIHFGKWRGQNRWPLAHVDNVAKAAYLAAVLPQAQGRVFQVLDAERTTMEGFYRQVAARYFPNRRYRTVCLPMWVGIVIGALGTALSNLFNTPKPVWDPTLYALYSVSRNLDFADSEYAKLLKLDSAKT